ncbi:DUF1684 domain-containing protein [Christiangramia aquimixticola]|uniref:DUF1684 domain-containing protein n=1 Tax=Christiangramia aquimixticola TaxID=1697558 RepID=UPI003AA8E15D
MQGGSKVLFLLMFILASGNFGYAQNGIKEAKAYQEKLNKDFANPKESPLEEKDLKNFTGLDFFEINKDYILEAEFVRTPAEPPFLMKTSTDRTPVYVKYGELYFKLKDKDFKLNVYQNQELVQDPEYYDYLFIPFTDLTNGRSTYGGGRYLDFRIPESKMVVLDFNRAYNPYCAYSGRFSCPGPPAENNLDTEVLAGVKAFEKP